MSTPTTLNYQYRADYHQANANTWRARRLAEEATHGHTPTAQTYLEYELHEAHLASVERFAGRSLGQVVDDPPEGVTNEPEINESQAEIKRVSQPTPGEPSLTQALSDGTPPDVGGGHDDHFAVSYRRWGEVRRPTDAPLGIVGTPAHTDDLARELPTQHPSAPGWTKALHAVRDERRRQLGLGYSVEHDDSHDETIWLSILINQLALVADVASEGAHPAIGVYLVRLAAVAVAWIEALDRQEATDA
jgi:hypothetical protein